MVEMNDIHSVFASNLTKVMAERIEQFLIVAMVCVHRVHPRRHVYRITFDHL